MTAVTSSNSGSIVYTYNNNGNQLTSSDGTTYTIEVNTGTYTYYTLVTNFVSKDGRETSTFVSTENVDMWAVQ